MTKQNSIFAKDFTNLYELSKTLRFELKPVGETSRLLAENKVFETDKLIQQKYEKTKRYLDRLHREFVVESLENLEFTDLEKYAKALKNVKKITKDTDKKQKNAWSKELENQEKRLRKEVVEQFNRTAKIWAKEKYDVKNKDLKILDEEAVFEKILFKKYGENEDGSLKQETIEKMEVMNKKTGEVQIIEESIFQGWKGFTGYFGKFFETRKNFYKDDGTSTALATRIIDQNLRRFVENMWELENYPDSLLAKFRPEDLEGFRKMEYYDDFVLQGNAEKTTGINLYNELVGKVKYEINQFRQNPQNKNPETGKMPRIIFLKTLDKQILSETVNFIDEISLPKEQNGDEADLRKVLEDLLKTGKEKTDILKKLFKEFTITNFSAENCEFNLNKIYWSKKGFEQISRMWTYEKKYWEDALAEIFRKNGTKSTKKKDAGFSFPEFIPLAYLKESLEEIYTEIEEQKNNKKDEDRQKVADFFWKDKYKNNEDEISAKKNIWTQFLRILQQELDEKFSRERNLEDGSTEIFGYKMSRRNLEKKLEVQKLEKTPPLTLAVKEFADDLLSIYQFSKYFAVEKSKNWDNSIEVDDVFYDEFRGNYYHDTHELIIKPYNLLRNYLTKKPWEEVQKWKLNFENPTLADGWDKNKETNNACVILRKDGKYFLALMKKRCNQIFSDKNRENFSMKNPGDEKYEKMVYKFFSDPAKMFPKVCFSAKGREFFQPSDELIQIYENGEFKKGDTFSVESMKKLIDFYKDCLMKYEGWKCYDFENLKPTSEYTENIGQFYYDVAKNGYQISFENISAKYIEQQNEVGNLYLFQIKNKDWNEGATGTKNLHTLYFESLFSTENMAHNFVMKLNGQAEIFYRPKAIEKKEAQRNFPRKITKKKRYTEDKIFFHMPMSMNRGTGKSFSYNKKINEFLSSNPDINILGIDRGEKHLAYFSVINQKGEIIKDKNGKNISGSLNCVGNFDYQLELEHRANAREKQRQDWQAVEGIKDLKKGYISQVVHKLAELIIKHNAIVIFEDLNMRFKQIRGGIEKSAYQQLEKSLIDKLNFLVDKKLCNPEDSEKAGNLLKAYQLAAPVEAFKDMGKQTGIIFYTQAAYTSKIDPVSGWRPNLYLKKGNAKTNKSHFEKFDNIIFSAEKNRFEFTYDLRKFMTSNKATFPQKTIWMVCSCVERWKGSRKESNNNQWGYDEYPLSGVDSITEKLKNLFEEYKIDFSKEIISQIKDLDSKGNEKFFSKLLFYFQLICQIRNTDGDLNKRIKQQKDSGEYDFCTDEETQKMVFDADFIMSPVEPFFDSRRSAEFGNNLPLNGDDNGAFNIARKGIIILERINEWGELNEGEREKIKYPDLFITNVDWDNSCKNN